MKLAITGSRNGVSRELTYFILKYVIGTFNIKPATLKSGGANGVDKYAEEFFKEYYQITPEILKPDYAAYPDNMKWKAPLDRNGDIVKGCDAVIAVFGGLTYGGKKGGTRDAAEKALAQGVPVIFVNVQRGTIQWLEQGQSKRMFE